MTPSEKVILDTRKQAGGKFKVAAEELEKELEAEESE